MFWLAAFVVVVALLIGSRFWRAWVRPWHDLEQLVRDVTGGNAPRTFILNGNPHAERIGIALEDVFLRDRELASRAREGESNVLAITGAMRDGLAVIEPDGRVRFLNPAARELFGVPEQVTGRVLETFRDPSISDVVATTLRNGETQTASINVQTKTHRAQRHVGVTSLPMPGENGAPAGALLLFHDMTQLQQLEQVRREFVANVSHELRTPLSIFRGYVETLIDEPDLDRAERERILRVMEKHSMRLHALVDDLLTLARLEQPDPHLHFAPVAVREFLGRVAKEWEKKAAAKQVTIVPDLAPDLPSILADEARLEEVAYNLLDNAVKYSREGGEIMIHAWRDGANVVVTFSDQGAGISGADLPRIFERFYRADKARSRELGGTGLGLAIVKHIVQLHGGMVVAESHLGRGTTIRVTLPIASA